MSDELITVGVAAIVSLAVSLVGFIGTRMQVKAQLDSLQREVESRRLDKLYDLRLKQYPQFFEITSLLSKPGLTGRDRIEVHRSTRESIRSWRSGEPMLVLSKYALQEIYNLEAALKANPENGKALEFSQEQLNKVWRLRQRARGALRRDLGLFYGDESEGNILSKKRTEATRKRGGIA